MMDLLEGRSLARSLLPLPRRLVLDPQQPLSASERVGREFRELEPGLGRAPPWRTVRRGARVPDPDGPVDAPRGEAPAVGAERHAEHAGRMATEGEDLLSGR